MIFSQCNLIQDGDAVLFYRFNRTLNGYLIAGLFVAPNAIAKIGFSRVWTYFVSEIVRADDIYCSVPLGITNALFEKYLTFHQEIDGLNIYKVDNSLKEQYSAFSKHLAVQASR